MGRHYGRVIPRDFFNEAKLLKCLGRLELLILDRKLSLTSEYDGEAFTVLQDIDGDLRVANYHVSYCGEELDLFTPLNSRERWPLRALYRGEEYCLFDEKGNWMPAWGRTEGA